MNKFFIGVIIVLSLIGIFTGKSEAVLITYDTGSSLAEIGNYYNSLPGNPDHSSGFLWIDYGTFVSETYGPHSSSGMAFSRETNPVWIAWKKDVHRISFWYGFAQEKSLRVRGFNNGSEVFFSGLLPKNSGGMYPYTAPDLAIDTMVFYGTPNYWTIDDLSYEIASSNNSGNPIPEPLTFFLLAPGLMGTIVLNKSKKGGSTL